MFLSSHGVWRLRARREEWPRRCGTPCSRAVLSLRPFCSCCLRSGSAVLHFPRCCGHQALLAACQPSTSTPKPLATMFLCMFRLSLSPAFFRGMQMVQPLRGAHGFKETGRYTPGVAMGPDKLGLRLAAFPYIGEPFDAIAERACSKAVRAAIIIVTQPTCAPLTVPVCLAVCGNVVG